MTQGIRDFTNATFAETLPKLKEIGPAAFRREVMDLVIMAFSISVASAATHYNHSLQQARIAAPKSVAGLGRPEGKKGGRKPLTTVDVIKVKTGEVIAAGISKGAAEKLIITAVAKGKAKLAIKATETVAETAAPEVAAVVAEPAQEAVAA